ncbi:MULTISPECIES: MarR family winged helix-turn-helix transcriptional regulator [Olivibacter]|jgi:DNA-binding MarR family transcriptional regulator|uniref:Transcriptional regulator, MarR family n=3 Tax=Sphingobacteriaceae TaxID=84566 RepID=F4C3Q6_SPHS2|nr:MarR family transcriptional regulator [Olivibacter jilunii]MDX3913486.1 MarR family transcriptional regulator [Pseudosphingobacterium sp.]QEL01623.1 MarR family transcriptional regulator [Olivibacter sp. LS-1]
MQKEPYNMYSFLLDRTARRVKQYAQATFSNKGFDITLDQWMVLKNLYEYADLTQKELAERCGKDQPTLTRIVDLLAKKELAERKVHPNDRRSFIVHLTDKGISKVEELSPQIKEIRTKAWENLNEDDFRQLERILNSIYNNLELK